jgi:hypothetical protein
LFYSNARSKTSWNPPRHNFSRRALIFYMAQGTQTPVTFNCPNEASARMMKKFYRHLMTMERLGVRGGVQFRAYWHDKVDPRVRVELELDDDMSITRSG